MFHRGRCISMGSYHAYLLSFFTNSICTLLYSSLLYSSWLGSSFESGSEDDNVSSGVTACSLSWTTPVLLFSLSMLTFCKNSAQAKMIFRSSLYQIIILVTKARVHQIKYHSIRCLPSNNTPAVFESSSISLICIASLPPLATMMELKLEVILVITTMELKLEVIIINPPPPFLCNIVESCWENWCCNTTVRWGGIPREGRRPKLSSRRTLKRMKLQ